MSRDPFETSRAPVREILVMAAEVSKCKSSYDVGIDLKWLRSNQKSVRRCPDGNDIGVTPYVFEQGPVVEALTGGLF